MGGLATGAICGTIRTALPLAARMSVVGGFVACVSQGTRTRSGRRRVAWSRRSGSLTLSSRTRAPVP
eukprot:14654643-Alexandrium_andersonii.AAC.1